MWDRLEQLTVFLWVVVTAIAIPSDGADGKIWAVLVAGSHEWKNYRHQADICHAYQIFHRHGIPDSNIIVMMYDDIAWNSNNSRPGVIINKPYGPNVYENVLKDYTGEDVNKENFLNVLQGNKEAMVGIGSGKVLESGPDDHVFVYFSDHGLPGGIICFPHEHLHSDRLMQALKTMHKKNMYKKLVFYLEACFSGAMFENILPKDINIYAVTAAPPNETSNAAYCFIEGYNTCLGDEFSVAWLEDIDSEEHQKKLTSETLQLQFENILKRVTYHPRIILGPDHPRRYGQIDIEGDKVIDYVGVSNSSTDDLGLRSTNTSLEKFTDSLPSQDADLYILEWQIKKSVDMMEKSKLIQRRNSLLVERWSLDYLFFRILQRMKRTDLTDKYLPLDPGMMPCYETVVTYFKVNCIDFHKTTYARFHMQKLANLCVEKVSPDDIIKVVAEECTQEIRL